MSEDAQQEAEALEAIFAEDFNKISADAFTLSIRPATGAEGACHVGLCLRVGYLSGYPDVAPDVKLEVEKGLNAKQLEEVRAVMAAAIQDNLGAPLVYALAESLRSWLEEHNEPPGDGSGFEEMMRRQKAAAKAAEKAAPVAAFSREEDPSIRGGAGAGGRGRSGVAAPLSEEEILAKRLREGTPVTTESFIAWRAAFERDMEAKRVADEAAGIVDPYASHRLERGRLTGRQLFEAEPSLALSDAAAEAEAEAAAAAAAAGAAGGGASSSAPSAGIVYAVDAARYAGAGDLLPDDEDDDDEDYTPGHDDGDDASDED